MENLSQIYSEERISSFMNKYKGQIQIDNSKPIRCGIINLDELHFAGIVICQLAKLLHQGQLVAFPTETVYGLGANALNSEAIINIFRAKKRPLSDPLIVHICSTSKIYTEKPQYLDAFANLFWPGPFTIVLKSTQLETTEILSAGTGSIGIRIPNNNVALELLKMADLPVAAPSANLFTHISPTSPAHVFNDFYDQKVHIIDAGRCQNGIESTVIKPSGNELHILRLGSLSRDAIMKKLMSNNELKHFTVVYENKYLDIQEDDEEIEKELNTLELVRKSSMEAPGQFLKHYSARINSFILNFQQSKHREKVNFQLSETVVIDFGNEIKNKIPNIENYRSLSEKYDAQEAMFNLYDMLRWAEIQPQAKQILLYDFDNLIDKQIFNDENILSLKDKIYRSASGQKVCLVDQEFYLCL